jgi:hypothetical protein
MPGMKIMGTHSLILNLAEPEPDEINHEAHEGHEVFSIIFPS